MDWHARALATADILIPWLIQVAPALKAYVQDVLNPRPSFDPCGPRPSPRQPAEGTDEEFDRQLALDDVLRESVTGEVVSNVVSKYLVDDAGSYEG